MDPDRYQRRRKLLAGALPYGGHGRTWLVNTGLDFLLREAIEELGHEGLRVLERDLSHCRRLAAAFPGIDIAHAAVVEPAAGDLVVLPVSKNRLELFRQLEQLALRVGPQGRIALYGEKKEGIGPAQALLEEHCDLGAPILRAGARLLIARPRSRERWGLPDAPDHYLAEAAGRVIKVAAQPGLFSWDALDLATALLLASARPRSTDRLLDLGCGSGVVAALLLAGRRVASAVLCDSDALALSAARRTLSLNDLQADVLADDAGQDLPERAFDLVLSNPPQHRDFAYERDTLGRMIVQSERVLAPKGRLYMVGPRDLGLEKALRSSFGEVDLVGESERNQVWRGLKRRRRRRPDPLEP